MWQLILDILNKLFAPNQPISTPTPAPVALPKIPNTSIKLPIDDYRNKLKVLVTDPKYLPKKDDKGNITETYCNFFVESVCHWFGYFGLDNLMANQMYDILRTNNILWKHINNDEAIQWAFQGKLVIAAQQNLNAHGHINVIAPENQKIHSEKWNQDVPLCANVGSNNFYGRGINFGFKLPPEIFLYLG